MAQRNTKLNKSLLDTVYFPEAAICMEMYIIIERVHAATPPEFPAKKNKLSL